MISLYSRVRELQPRWEKGYFFLAKYYDDLLMDARKRQEEVHISSSNSSFNPVTEEKPWWSYLPEVLLYYAKGLHRGHNHLFQALPRLLTLWFEFGALCHRDEIPSNKLLKSVHTRVTIYFCSSIITICSYTYIPLHVSFFGRSWAY